MLIKNTYEGFEQLIVIKTSCSLSDLLGVIHAQLWQNLLQLIHLLFSTFHGSNDIISINRPFFEELFNAVEVFLELSHLRQVSLQSVIEFVHFI